MPKIALQKQRWCVEVMSKANNREVEAAGSGGLPGEQRTNLFLMLVVFSLEGLSTCSPIDLSGVSQSAAVWKDQISQLFSQQLEEAVGTPVSAGAGLLPCAAWCLGINSHTLWPCLFPPPQLSSCPPTAMRFQGALKEKTTEKRDLACLPAEKGESFSSLPCLMLSMSPVCDPCYRENQNQRSNTRKTLLFFHCSVTVSQAWMLMVWLCTVVAEVFKMFKVLLGARGVG